MANRNRQTTESILFDERSYRYRRKSTYKEVSQYVCCERGCFGKGESTADGNIICTKNHNHLPRIGQRARDVFIDQLWQAVITTDDDIRRIYNRIALNNRLAAISETFPSIENKMRKWRQEPHPPIPDTLLEYGELINQERWQNYREYGEGNWLVRTRAINEEAHITVIGDIDFLATCGNIQILYVDATFAVCPKKPKKLQFLTIMGKIDDTPEALAWIFMNKKTQVAYEAAFEMFRDEFAPNIRPTTVHADFEAAIANAMRLVYRNIVVIPCYFHHTHAIYNRFVKDGGGKTILKRLARWDIAKSFYRKLITIALLPPDSIIPAFNWLLDNTPADVGVFFADLYYYYADTWLLRYGPDVFSMYQLRERTNNYIEAYHRTLPDLLGTHPDIWTFTRKLKNYQSVIRIEVESLNRGQPVRRSTMQRYENRELVLTHMWRQFDDGTLTIPRFLACANHVSEAFKNEMIITTAEDVNRFQRAPVHNINIQPPHTPLPEINIEEFNEGEGVPILKPDPATRRTSILIFENREQSLCTRCHESILNIKTLPCQHWFLCRGCTKTYALECVNRQQEPTCLFCHQPCYAFQAVQIS